MARHKDANVDLPEISAQGTRSWESINTSLLMDIRDELKALNATLGCYRVGRMTEDIRRIDRRLQQHLPLKGPKT
jgi:hypothetical protein